MLVAVVVVVALVAVGILLFLVVVLVDVMVAVVVFLDFASDARGVIHSGRVLSLGRVKESKESKVLIFQDLKIPRSQDCVDLRDCRIF